MSSFETIRPSKVPKIYCKGRYGATPDMSVIQQMFIFIKSFKGIMVQCAHCPILLHRIIIAPSIQKWQALIEVQWGRNPSVPCLGEEQETRELMTELPDWDSLILHNIQDLVLYQIIRIESNACVQKGKV